MLAPVTAEDPHNAPPEASFQSAASPAHERPTRRHNYPQILATLERRESRTVEKRIAG